MVDIKLCEHIIYSFSLLWCHRMTAPSQHFTIRINNFALFNTRIELEEWCPNSKKVQSYLLRGGEREKKRYLTSITCTSREESLISSSVALNAATCHWFYMIKGQDSVNNIAYLQKGRSGMRHEIIQTTRINPKPWAIYQGISQKL